jgi:small subunit ribosomal protein S21
MRPAAIPVKPHPADCDRPAFTTGGRGAKRAFQCNAAWCGPTTLTGEASVQVLVRDNNVDQALRALKKKMQREGVFREMKLRRSYEKPSERRARERAEAVRRYRKLLRKRMEREGY